jgi:ferritin-like metal-binding protein YciE
VETAQHLPGWERLLEDQEQLVGSVSHPELRQRLEADIKETRAQVVRLRRRKDSHD